MTAMATPTPPRVPILGTGVHALNMPTAVALIDEALASRRRGYVCVTGVHGIMEAQDDPGFLRILNASFLTTPDGMPTVWIGRLRGHRHMSRVYGPDLMLEVCRMSVARGWSHFFYGGGPGVAERLAAMMAARCPGLRVAGTFTPPFRPLTDAEEASLAALVAGCRPDCFWVGLSTPKQERFMAAHAGKLETTLMFGVGAAFDLGVGDLRDAPAWMKAAGLQWLHRGFQEPRRLWRRYLFNNPRFVWKASLELLGLRRYPAPPPA
jgi:N-acetylglucosaminyldiphosphoundecaprenol N-acetyl-beta-D-mannosaminyltransferase